VLDLQKLADRPPALLDMQLVLLLRLQDPELRVRQVPEQSPADPQRQRERWIADNLRLMYEGSE